MTRVPNNAKRNNRRSHIRRLARERRGYALSSPTAVAIATIGPDIWKARLDAFNHICNTISDSITSSTKAESSKHLANDAISGAALLADSIRLFDFLLVSLANTDNNDCAALPISRPPSSQDLRELALTSLRYAQSTQNDATGSSSSSSSHGSDGDGKIKTELDITARKLLRGQRDSPNAFSTTINLAKRVEMKDLQVDVAAYLVSLAFRYPCFLGADVLWLAAIKGTQISGYSRRDISVSLLHLARLAAGEVRNSGLRRMFPEASQWVDAHPVANGTNHTLARAASGKRKEQEDSTVKQERWVDSADASRVKEEDLNAKQRWLEGPDASLVEEIKLTVKQEPWLASADASRVEEDNLNVKQEPRLVGADASLVDEEDLNVKQEPMFRW